VILAWRQQKKPWLNASTAQSTRERRSARFGGYARRDPWCLDSRAVRLFGAWLGRGSSAGGIEATDPPDMITRVHELVIVAFYIAVHRAPRAAGIAKERRRSSLVETSRIDIGGRAFPSAAARPSQAPNRRTARDGQHQGSLASISANRADTAFKRVDAPLLDALSQGFCWAPLRDHRYALG